MCRVSIPENGDGRARQKQRTRDSLIAAARALVADGVTPTVEAAAAAAAMSRATAYRYFPNQRALLLAAHPETGTRSLLASNPPEDPAQRLDEVIRAFTELIVATETQQRAMLRLSLGADPVQPAALPLRQGRAIAWIQEALLPLQDRLPDSDLQHLTLAIRSATGIEALVWLTDIAGLSRADAVQLMRWSSRALLHAATTGNPPNLNADGGSPIG
jgi:AcrR family transcriptional regulator